ncbi:hypothetical protein PINS_up009529 [Pythium insidiosum]|nr:hypothetical protein PINS_up009529 [Pythium insidiosum]
MTCSAVHAPMQSHGLLPGAIPDELHVPTSASSSNAKFRATSLRRQRSTEEDIEANSFRVITELGRGLQGRVDLAFDVFEGHLVAIKRPVFNADDASDCSSSYLLDCQIQEISRECRALRRVRHDNVLRYVRSAAGYQQNRTYRVLATEFASNGDMFDVISSGGALPESIAKVFCAQLLRAVAACHARGVVHRDIKLENLLLDDQFTLKLADFGLASIVSEAFDDDQSTTDDATAATNAAMLRDAVGTPLYMAPEIDDNVPYRAAPIDVWACGVVLFALLTGYPPFDAPEQGDVWFDHLARGDVASFWAAQPPTLKRPSPAAMHLIGRLLCVDPARRASVTEALAHEWLCDDDALERDELIAEMTRRQRSAWLAEGSI